MAAADYRLLTETTGQRIAAALENVSAMVGPPGEVSEAELTAKLADKADVIVDTASGAIASFPDGMAAPAKDITIGIEPVQDLHGYDHPWPAGGGKNKFNGTFLQGYWAYADGIFANSPKWITTEKIPCKPSTSYTVSADAKVTRWQGFVWYDSNGNYISTDNLRSDVNIGLTKTSPSTAAYLIFNIASYPDESATIAPSDVTHFQLEEGSSSTAYAPYSNICPISGWTGANVVVSPTTDAQDGTTYPISWQSSAGTVYGGTLDVTTGVLTVTWAEVDLGTLTWLKETSVTEPFFYSSTLSTALTKSIEGYNDEYIKCAKYNAPHIRPSLSDEVFGSSAVADKSITYHRYSINNPAYIYIKDSSYTDAIAFAAAMSGVQLVYQLATTQTYQLTPTEVEMLLGENNVWADTGDSTVTYRADTKLYIQKINAPTDDDMIADAQIASGKYFIVGGNLYKSTTTIPAGDTITPGTNCILTNLADALNALNT